MTLFYIETRYNVLVIGLYCIPSFHKVWLYIAKIFSWCLEEVLWMSKAWIWVRMVMVSYHFLQKILYWLILILSWLFPTLCWTGVWLHVEHETKTSWTFLYFPINSINIIKKYLIDFGIIIVYSGIENSDVSWMASDVQLQLLLKPVYIYVRDLSLVNFWYAIIHVYCRPPRRRNRGEGWKRRLSWRVCPNGNATWY